MMNFIKHLRITNKFQAVFFAAAVLTGCGEKPEQTDYVARVNDSYLTEEEFESLVDTNSAHTFYKNEIIRNWIDKEILFQEAVKSGLVDDQKFKSLIDKSKKNIAASLLIEKYSSDREENITNRELVNYYSRNKNEFLLDRNSYLLNIIHFNNEDRAAEFRSLLLESDWKRSLNVFSNDSTIISYATKTFVGDTDIYSEKIIRVVKRLHPLEISIVISEREGYYTVVQVLDKYPADSVPEFDVIKKMVKKRYIAFKRKEMIESFIKNLYSNYEIEVKN